MLGAMTEDHSAHVRLHIGGTETTGAEVDEVVPARHLGDDLYVVLGTPGVVYGCAAGDTVRVRPDGRFVVVERGGNIALHIYGRHQFEDRQIDALRARFEPLDGIVEAPPGARFAVVTVPATAGFPAIEAAVGNWVSAQAEAEWFFGNVYDDEGAALRWWEQPN